MWRALTKLVSKWAHMHVWKVCRTETLERCSTGLRYSSKEYIRLHTLQCETCGMIKLIQHNIK
jgi:hypothetical protein